MTSGFLFFFGGYFGNLMAALVVVLVIALGIGVYAGWMIVAEKLLGYRWVTTPGDRSGPQLLSPKHPRHPNNRKFP